MALRLSVLDLSPIRAGSSSGDALRATIDLARHADALGLTRYWLAEHHNTASLACPAPAIVMPLVLQATRGIRVGAGGIMLPNHAPLAVAEAFRVLCALFPGRVDLGLGRAAGTDPRTAHALRRGQRATADDFPAQLDELFAYFAGERRARPAFHASIVAIPTDAPSPEPWILGSSEVGAELAAARGLPFAFARHLNPDGAADAMRRYRARFVPSAVRAAPEAVLALSVVCAETDGRAEELAASAELGMVRFAQGVRDLPMATESEARAHVYDDVEQELRRAFRARHLVGGVDRVKGALEDLAREAQTDEVMVLTHVHDDAARRRSYELIASALAVTPRG